MGLPEAWEAYLRFRPGFAAASDERFYPMAWLDREVAEGRVLIWWTDAAAILAEIKVYPSGLYDLHGLLATGRLSDIADNLIPQAEAWAHSVGCDGVLIQSREGWQRVMRGRGYETYQVSIRRPLQGRTAA